MRITERVSHHGGGLRGTLPFVGCGGVLICFLRSHSKMMNLVLRHLRPDNGKHMIRPNI